MPVTGFCGFRFLGRPSGTFEKWHNIGLRRCKHAIAPCSSLYAQCHIAERSARGSGGSTVSSASGFRGRAPTELYFYIMNELKIANGGNNLLGLVHQ